MNLESILTPSFHPVFEHIYDREDIGLEQRLLLGNTDIFTNLDNQPGLVSIL